MAGSIPNGQPSSPIWSGGDTEIPGRPLDRGQLGHLGISFDVVSPNSEAPILVGQYQTFINCKDWDGWFCLWFTAILGDNSWQFHTIPLSSIYGDVVDVVDMEISNPGTKDEKPMVSWWSVFQKTINNKRLSKRLIMCFWSPKKESLWVTSLRMSASELQILKSTLSVGKYVLWLHHVTLDVHMLRSHITFQFLLSNLSMLWIINVSYISIT